MSVKIKLGQKAQHIKGNIKAVINKMELMDIEHLKEMEVSLFTAGWPARVSSN